MDVAMINDEMLPVTELPIPYTDRGIFFGDGVYEVIRSYDGQIFAMDEHLARFQRSLHEVHINGPEIETIRGRILEAFDRAGYANAKIYFHITRGSESRNHLPDERLQPNFFLTIDELEYDSDEVKHKGIAVSTEPDWRWKRCDIKSLNLLANVLARMAAAKKGASEAILVGDDGMVTEGAGSAFFTIDARNGAVITRPLGHEILPSITREKVLQVAENVGLEVVEKTLTPQQAADCDELFIAVTTKDIVPVTLFDNKPIGDGKCGKMTSKLIEAFQRYIKELR